MAATMTIMKKQYTSITGRTIAQAHGGGIALILLSGTPDAVGRQTSTTLDGVIFIVIVVSS